MTLAEILAGLGGQIPGGATLPERDRYKRGLGLMDLLATGHREWTKKMGVDSDPLIDRGEAGMMRVAKTGHNIGGAYIPVTMDDGTRYNVWYDEDGKRTVRRLGPKKPSATVPVPAPGWGEI